MPVTVTIHESQFPGVVQEQLKESLRTRQFNHKLHFQTYQQTEKWRALHRAYADVDRDAQMAAIYDAAFQKTNEVIRPAKVVGLCCGYAEKEVRLLTRFQNANLTFVASDTSVPMVMQAAEAAAKVIGEPHCLRFVCDLQEAPDLSQTLTHPSGPCVFTFLGSLHNFEPELIFPRLANLLKPEDLLLLSANLVPGPNPASSIMRIVPQYDNALTFDWLFQLLADLGFYREDGVFEVKVEPCPTDPSLSRISIYYVLEADRLISFENERFQFKSGESLRLFYSYRYTPPKINEWLSRVHLNLIGEWIGKSGEEGVFLAKKSV